MSASATRAMRALLLGLFVLCASPTLAYWMLVAHAPHLDVRAARELLMHGKAQVVFVEPLPESQAPAFEGITTTLADLAPDKATLLICRGGIRSALAAQRLSQSGLGNVWSVSGGMQEWIAAGGGLSRADLSRMNLTPSAGWQHFRVASWFEQGLLLVSFFGIKTIYTILAIGIVFVLWRRTEPELRGVRWASGCFVVGELSCFVNVMFYGERSVGFEHVHGLLMAVSLGFACYAALRFILDRVGVRGESRSCPLQAICGHCTHPVTCRMRRLAQLTVPMLATLAWVPMTAELKDGASTTLVLGRLHGYGHAVVHQLFELRYLPSIAFLLYLACEVLLLFGRARDTRLAQVSFAAATGALGFSYLRMLLVAPFANELVWFAVWEEFTELLYIGAMISVLWVFRAIWFELEPTSP